MDFKTRKCALVGYTSNGYVLWCNEERKIISARDVIFDESVMYIDSCAQTQKKSNEVFFDDELDFSTDQSTPVSESASEIETEDTSRPKRTVRQPAYLNDYITAYNVELEDVPENFAEIAKRDDHRKWEDAMDKEFDSMHKNNVWSIIERPTHSKTIRSRWVFRKKKKGESEFFKARLVAKGFQQEKSFSSGDVYAPVANLTTLRSLLAVSNHRNYYIEKLDVCTAFLYGELNDEENVLMEIPDGLSVDSDKYVCRLQKAIYGLKEAPKRWNNRLHTFLLKLVSFVQNTIRVCTCD